MLVLNISFEHAVLNKSNFHKIKSITNGLCLTVECNIIIELSA